MDFPTFEKKEIFLGEDYLPEEKYVAIQNVKSLDTVGVVTNKYELIQHEQLYANYEEAIQKANITVERTEVTFNKNGSRMIINAKFEDRNVTIDNSRIDYGLTIINSVNGNARLMILPFSLRIMCMNQITHKVLAISQKIRHCSIIRNTVDNLDVSINMVSNNFDIISDVYDNWTRTDVICTKEVLLKYNIPKKYIEPILREAPTTAWELFNTLTDLNTHDESRSIDCKLQFDRTIENVMNEVAIEV